MRKKFLLLAFLRLSACAGVHADDLGLLEGGFPFSGKRVEVIWMLSTNRLPAMLNIFNVVPAKFSQETISNVVALGEYADPEKVKNGLLPALKGKDCLFEEEPAHKAISISPSRGHISYVNTKAIALPGQPVTGIATEEDVLKRSLEIAKKLGIASSEFAIKPGSDTFLCWHDRRVRSAKVDGKVVKREIAHGIFLYRAIDGVSFEGMGFCGGLYLNFGNDSRIAELDLSWRNLELKRRSHIADYDQLTRWIKAGRAVIQMEEADIEKVKKIRIINVVPHYRGRSSAMEQISVYPFAMIEAAAEIGERELPVTLLCPLIKD